MSDQERPREHTLLETDNAMLWAEEFCRIFRGRLIETFDHENTIGPGTMVAWFANAIETAKRIAVDYLAESMNAERQQWEAEKEKVTLAYIDATNPGIDMDEVRRERLLAHYKRDPREPFHG